MVSDYIYTIRIFYSIQLILVYKVSLTLKLQKSHFQADKKKKKKKKAENRHSLNPVRRCRSSSTDDGEDRLSSLPHAILTEILSRLPITSAASTSVLSHRWRHLWTGVTHFDICYSNETNPVSTEFLKNIFLQLTSPKINVFKIQIWRSISSAQEELESCFHEICRRNVHQLIYTEGDWDHDNFPIPTCLLSCQSLVILELSSLLEFDYMKNRDVKLPNRKKLSLRYLIHVPAWLGSLHESSPLLEELTLMFNLFRNEESVDTLPLLNLNFPNLKSLKLEVLASYVEPGVDEISIDAPKLAHIEIDHTFGTPLPYNFCHNPTALVKACINFDKKCKGDEGEEIHRFLEFFRGMSSIYNLELEVRCCDVFTYLSVNVNPHLFSNLVHLTTTLHRVDLNDCKNVLVSLQCFPNLKHLNLQLKNMDYGSEMTLRYWHAPDIVTTGLMSKLKTIDIKGLRLSGSIGGLKLLGYILANAKVLEKLYLDVWFAEREFCIFLCKLDSEKKRLWEEREFCISLFKLPRSSPTCDVEFSGSFITSSSSDFDFVNGKLICKMA